MTDHVPTGPVARTLRLVWRLPRTLARAPIRVYMRWISPWTPPSCRFRPTCSAYADEALALHGLVRGGWLAARRVLRCHAFSEPGVDPVPGGRLDAPETERVRPGWLRARPPER